MKNLKYIIAALFLCPPLFIALPGLLRAQVRIPGPGGVSFAAGGTWTLVQSVSIRLVCRELHGKHHGSIHRKRQPACADSRHAEQ